MRLVILSAIAFAVGLAAGPLLLPPRYQYVKLGEYPARFDRRTGTVEVVPFQFTAEARAQMAQLAPPSPAPAQPVATEPGLMAGR